MCLNSIYDQRDFAIVMVGVSDTVASAVNPDHKKLAAVTEYLCGWRWMPRYLCFRGADIQIFLNFERNFLT